jgi:hypothetical protein
MEPQERMPLLDDRANPERDHTYVEPPATNRDWEAASGEEEIYK